MRSTPPISPTDRNAGRFDLPEALKGFVDLLADAVAARLRVSAEDPDPWITTEALPEWTNAHALKAAAKRGEIPAPVRMGRKNAWRRSWLDLFAERRPARRRTVQSEDAFDVQQALRDAGVVPSSVAKAQKGRSGRP
jgi:hypothetical protein